MGEETATTKPLLDQIYEEMFAALEQREDYDPETLQKLRALATAGDLTKTQKVEAAVKAAPGSAK